MKTITRTVKRAVCFIMIVLAVCGPKNVLAEEDSAIESEISDQEEYLEEYEYPEESLEPMFFLTTEEVEHVRNSVADLPLGTAGRLYSEDIGLNVSVEHYDMFSKRNSNAEAQKIVDRKDTAIWMDYHINTMVIGDHYDQDFEAIKQSVPGETVLYLVSRDGVQRFVCQKVEKGHNDGETILAEDGTDLLLEDPGGLLLYTCDGSWKNIFIAQYKNAAE